MANKWAVETEKLTSSAGKIEDETGRYNTEWNKLYSEVQALKSANWTGEASDTFNQRLEGYRNDFQQMEDTLKKYVEFLRQAAKSYETTESNLRDQANNLTVGN